MAKNRRRATGQRPTVSASLVVIAVVIFFILQWNNGSLSGFFGFPQEGSTDAGAAVSTEQPDVSSDDAPVAQNAESAPVDAPEAEPTQTLTQEPAPARATLPPTNTPRAPPTATATVDVVEEAGNARFSDLPTIAYAELPREAQETLRLIEQGGPFPFDRDGIVFQNREGILPNKPRGYYREYTVITPGISHRGARRIVTGAEGERYYTDDHYESFREIVE